MAHTAEVTWYDADDADVACGFRVSNNDYIAAMAFGGFDGYPGATANPNTNPICNKALKATYEGKSVVVRIVDRCAGCMKPDNVDLSPTAFSVLADQSKGRLFGVEWDWTDLPPGPVKGDGNVPENSPPIVPPKPDGTTTPPGNEGNEGTPKNKERSVHRRASSAGLEARGFLKRVINSDADTPSPPPKSSKMMERRAKHGRSVLAGDVKRAGADNAHKRRHALGKDWVLGVAKRSQQTGTSKPRMERRKVNDPIVVRDVDTPRNLDPSTHIDAA
jgi:hypothetical protein